MIVDEQMLWNRIEMDIYSWNMMILYIIGLNGYLWDRY